jgi:hypothetical protein
MATITLYSFYNSGTGILTNVDTEDDHPFLIYANSYTFGGGPYKPSAGTVISRICQGTTLYEYKVIDLYPYASVEQIFNSNYCGYTPPACDIFEKSFSKTDETNTGANDGTANMFCVSSFMPITYILYKGVDIIATNTIGLFTGLAPDNYSIHADDSNGCAINIDFTILPFNPALTRCKYRLQFESILNGDVWRLDFLDQKHQYDPDIYPLYLTGTGNPLIKTTANQGEDKTEPILATTLDVNLINNEIFTVDEFAKADERTWFMQLFKNGDLDFQGWLLPDPTQDEYSDPEYPIALTITDGLASLKGEQFGDPSIFTLSSEMVKIYTQLYGLYSWSYLVKICLDWLDYNYGNTTLVSSLRDNGTYNDQFWANVSTWGDNYYDSTGTPIDVYTALSNILSAVKLSIVQHKGSFVLVNWNDLYYSDKPLQASDYNLSFYTFNSDMTSIISTGTNKPEILQVGSNKIGKPINPKQSINYDLSYGILKADINFNILALLYENPSFEIGAVQGELPSDYNHIVGTVDAFVNYDPVTESIGSGAYDGEWELKVRPVSVTEGTSNFFENNSPFFNIDQPNKLLNISFVWKVPQNFNTTLGFSEGYVFAFLPVFIVSGGVDAYFLKVNPSTSISYHDYLANGRHPPNNPQSTYWEHLSDTYYTEGDACSIKGTPTTDYIGWQSYSIVAPPFPEGQTGTLSIRWYSVKSQLYDPSKYVLIPFDPDSFKQDFYIDVPSSDPGYYLIDDLNITLSDASTATNLQIGEVHTITNVTNYSKAETKELNLSMFTYPPNKRLAGQFMYGLTYDIATTFDSLKFQLQTTAKVGKLPFAVINSWGRTYQRPMYIFEGDLKCDNVPFYGLFQIDGYPNVLFLPFSVSSDLRNSVVHIIVVEFDDSDAQIIYNYKAKYERSSRLNG